jgi:hypothetical protein
MCNWNRFKLASDSGSIIRVWHLSCDGVEILGPHRPGSARPGAPAVAREGVPRRHDGELDVLRRGRRDVTDGVLGGRVDDGDAAAEGGLAPPAADEEAAAGDRWGRGHVCLCWGEVGAGGGVDWWCRAVP